MAAALPFTPTPAGWPSTRAPEAGSIAQVYNSDLERRRRRRTSAPRGGSTRRPTAYTTEDADSRFYSNAAAGCAPTASHSSSSAPSGSGTPRNGAPRAGMGLSGLATQWMHAPVAHRSARAATRRRRSRPTARRRAVPARDGRLASPGIRRVALGQRPTGCTRCCRGAVYRLDRNPRRPWPGDAGTQIGRRARVPAVGRATARRCRPEPATARAR